MPFLPRRSVPLALVFCGVWFLSGRSRADAAAERAGAPLWVQETVPDSIRPFVGKSGLPAPWQQRPGSLAPNVAGLDLWQADHFIVYRPETAAFLYEKYTPAKVDYQPGLFPTLEKIVAKGTTPKQTDMQKAMALLTVVMAKNMRCPAVPPEGPQVAPDRNLNDEDLVASGCGWSNEQARVFVRFCQIAGIPARMIYLFYSDNKTGHVVAEFFADGQWRLADTSYLCVFPDENGRLLSAAELHAPEGRAVVQRSYLARWNAILKPAVKQSAGRKPTAASATAEPPQPLPENVGKFGSFGVLNYPLPHAVGAEPVTLVGHTTVERGVTVASGNAVIAIQAPPAARYRFSAEIQVAEAGSSAIRFLTAEPANPKSPAAGEVQLRNDGRENLTIMVHNRQAGKKGGATLTHRYWPEFKPKPQPSNPTTRSRAQQDLTEEQFQAIVDKKAAQRLAEDKLHLASTEAQQRELSKAGREFSSAVDHWVSVMIDREGDSAAAWVEGCYVGRLGAPSGPQDADGQEVIALALSGGHKVRQIQVTPLGGDSLQIPIDLSSYANDRFSAPLGASRIEVDGIEFQLPSGSQNQVNLRPAGWLEIATDGNPWATEGYDSPSPTTFDPRMPMLRVPGVDYIAAHVLAVADDDPRLISTLKLRPRSFNHNLTFQYDFEAPVPRQSQLAALGDSAVLNGNHVVSTPAGRLAHVAAPLNRAMAQDLGNIMGIELTKEVRVAVRAPQACRWRYRPLGLPSGVRIAAMTLEKAPLQMRVTSSESGHLFVQPASPVFQVRLENITAAAQPYTLAGRCQHLDGTTAESRTSGSVPAGETAEVSLELSVPKRGYYTLDMTVIDSSRRELVRHTSFAVLPPDTRRHRDQSPFGTYDYGSSAYGVPNNNELLGPLMVKLGMRYGMGFSVESCKKYGLLHGQDPVLNVEAWRKRIANDPDYPPYVITLHEASFSGDHITRVPDLFTDRTYQLTEKEENSVKKAIDSLSESMAAMHKEFPQVKISLGNGPVTTLEELLRHHFPAELFDSGGNEAGAYNRPPEAQPPDWIANNASLWMVRRMLDAYGYKDKPITQCHEICYPNTNPGNLSLPTQADYFVRHAMHSLAWEIPQIRMGIMADVGASYYYSNWGGSGFFNCYPELNPKPSAVAWATMTRVLDGAKFRRVLDLGSPSLYGILFDRAEDHSHVLALWTIRGHRPLRLTFAGAGEIQLVDDQANETSVSTQDGAVDVAVSPTPLYLITKADLTGAAAGPPRYDEKPAPAAIVLSDLASLDDWTVEQKHNALLEYYNFLTPRRLGDFGFEPAAEFEGREHVLRVSPRPIGAGKDTMPMYAVLAHRRGISMPGTPTEIGIWVNGNSSWGRLIYELEDASGQRWISVGNALRGWTEKFVDGEVPELRASKRKVPIDDWCDNDSFGWSRIDFDGWRYVAFPAPGAYPGEGYHWPGNVHWFHDGDGVVHYPLVFKKLVVELPEKTLHVRDFAPTPRPEIYLKDLTSAQEDTNEYMVKKTIDPR